jgi:hypothetical protein
LGVDPHRHRLGDAQKAQRAAERGAGEALCQRPKIALGTGRELAAKIDAHGERGVGGAHSRRERPLSREQ